MKIIIFLALAGLSLAAGIIPPPPMPNQMPYPVPGTAPNPEACIKIAIQAASELFPALTKFVCEYYGSFKNNEGNFEAALQKVVDLMGATGCPIDALLNLPKRTVEGILMGGGEAVKDLANKLLVVLGALGLTPAVAGAACILLETLPLDCAQKLLANLDLKILQGLFCTKKGDLTAGQLSDILLTVDCVAKNLHGVVGPTPLGSALDALLAKLSATLGVTVDSVLDTLRQLLLGLNLDLCIITDLLNPLLGLVGG